MITEESDYEKTYRRLHDREGAQARYEKFLKRCEKKGIDPKEREANFCTDCGNFPAYQPRVLVANLKTSSTDKYRLDVPPICDICCFDRGLTRHSFLVPKTEELQGPSEMMERYLERIKPWVERVQERTVKEISESWDVSEEEAKSIMGYL